MLQTRLLKVAKLSQSCLPLAGIGILCLTILSGCVSSPDTTRQQTAPDNFPHETYTEAPLGSSVYRVDSRASEVIVTVRRGGIMASLGHDHIIASEDLQGFILLNTDSQTNIPRCRADFYAPLANLVVDNSARRAVANLLTSPSVKDIAGTTANMHRSIESVDFPFVQLHSSDCLAARSNAQSQVILSLHGVSQTRQLTINIAQESDQRITFSGTFSILQSDFGIEPFSIMNGLIKVEDKLELSYKIVALKKVRP